jgi:menaquinone-dependent protoporphyrinogen oxidase
VLGSAVYYSSWLKEATEWVRRNRTVLAQRPVWLFSSGPRGTEVQDAEQQPKEMAEFLMMSYDSVLESKRQLPVPSE